jgi:nucleotide-binding universal stress UspA family protein
MSQTMITPSAPFSAETFKETGPVLVALKPFDGGASALATAQWLAARSESGLQVLSVIERDDTMAVAGGAPPLSQFYYDGERDDAAARLQAQAAEGPHGDAACRVDVLEGLASRTIAQTARDRGASHIDVGTGRHDVLGRFLYGERALEVVRDAVGPVLVVPPSVEPPFKHAMVAVDFSQASMRAAVASLALLDRGGRLTLVHVKSAVRLNEDDAGWWNDAYELRSREMLARFADALPEPPGITVDTSLLYGAPVEKLLGFATAHGADVIACGRQHHSFMERILVGSVSSALVRRAPCAVLVAPERPYDKSLDDASWMTGVRVSRDRDEWPELLREVSRRNAGRRAQLVLETERPDGIESLEKGYSFLAAEYDLENRKVSIILGDRDAPGSQLTHRIAGLRELEMVADSTGRDTRLQFDASPGRCVVSFGESVKA